MCNKKKKLEEQLNAEKELSQKEREERIRCQKELEQLQAQNEKNKLESRPTVIEDYYNIAYSTERKRLNKMFGTLHPNFGAYPEEKPEKVFPEKVVYKEPDLTNYVPKKKYKSAKGRSIFFCIMAVLFLLATVAIVLMHLDYIPQIF